MIGKQILYHGSEANRANSIFENQKFNTSKDDRHWLGDGVYFYIDKVLAYRWIWNMYEKRHGEIISNNKLFGKYGILNAEVTFLEDRVYNLKEIEFQNDFSRIKHIVMKKAAEGSKLSKNDFVDGTVLNLMFNEFGYDKNYDIVIALFSNNKKNLSDLRFKSRIWYGTEEQVCVKNEKCILSININQPEDFEKVYELMKKTYKTKYNSKRKNIYKQ
ncbi:hypothetical protein SAMN02745751_02305 [Dethiosulfatibacter aminovorans DSM 17477]|uniref:Uncharacterized protein n=1 Tax=Dethiosulfatibacter aminovorans DSM 17477 TaxID=1121476 RepID=A0A1M6IFW5_9FIRM|nr:hypothetical protein [Dethiosulfatibacter aminovorans]SHJ33342.1 hypothetical protein SAMN02745751_02305 [Dethiosulfatibacter aminovorans DSM 17477]